MVSEIKIRPYQSADKNQLVSQLKALRYHLIPFNPDRLSSISDVFFENYIQEIESDLKQQARQVLVAEWEGKIVGYVDGKIQKLSAQDKLQFIDEPYGEVIDLYVLDEFREQGLGTRLLESITNFFKEKSCKKISLVVLKTNASAMKYYQQVGFAVESLELVKRI